MVRKGRGTRIERLHALNVSRLSREKKIYVNSRLRFSTQFTLFLPKGLMQPKPVRTSCPFASVLSAEPRESFRSLCFREFFRKVLGHFIYLYLFNDTKVQDDVYSISIPSVNLFSYMQTLVCRSIYLYSYKMILVKKGNEKFVIFFLKDTYV